MIKAVAQDDWLRQSVQVRVGESDSSGQITREYTWFGEVSERTPGAVSDPDAGLLLPEEVARAVYEALADHFGHGGHDARAIRRDYDAERARVDKMLAHLIGRPS